MRVWSKTVVLAIVAAASIPLASRADTEWDKTVAAAKAEGAVIVYTSTTNAAMKKIGAAFEARYGIPATVQYLRSAELRERLRTEHTSGRAVADVVMSGNTFRSFSPEFLQKHPPLPNAAKLKAPAKDDGLYIQTYILPFGLLVNTSLVKPEDEPKSWKDLTDPKWKGKLLGDDPRAQGGGNVTFWVLQEKLGRDYLEAMGKQGMVYTTDPSNSERRIAQGEFPLYVAFVLGNIAKLQGLPVKPIVPVEGAPYNDGVATIMAGARHPNAARLYLDFLMSDEAQDLILSDGLGSVTGRPSDPLPPSSKFIASINLMGNADPAKQSESLRLMGEVFK